MDRKESRMKLGIKLVQIDTMWKQTKLFFTNTGNRGICTANVLISATQPALYHSFIFPHY